MKPSHATWRPGRGATNTKPNHPYLPHSMYVLVRVAHIPTPMRCAGREIIWPWAVQSARLSLGVFFLATKV